MARGGCDESDGEGVGSGEGAAVGSGRGAAEGAGVGAKVGAKVGARLDVGDSEGVLDGTPMSLRNKVMKAPPRLLPAFWE